MHISKIELENIKSHRHSTFEFARGTTVITGENGAGKTTIIEAIAWVLFDLLEYKKEDFIRRGEKKGSVRLTLVSGLDEREYVVFRDTGNAYNVTDPRLDKRIADKKEEVFRFLWQHLGLEPGADLASLFRQAIGVPQGTFTAIFLATAAVRKPTFDRLLKVEEYRQAAEKLRDTSRYIDIGIADTRELVARYEGELTRAALVEEEFRTYQGRTGTLAAEVAKIESEIELKRRIVAKLDELEQVEKALESVRADQKRLQESFETIAKAHGEIATLKPKVVEQEKLEAEAVELRQRVADLRAIQKQAADLDAMIERLRTSYKANADQLREAVERSQRAGEVPTLEKRDAELLREIAALNASLERDEKFQSEIKNGFCPVLSEKCLNLKPGQTLEAFVATQFSDLKSRIVTLDTARVTVLGDLKQAREAEKFAALIDGLRQREEQLKTDGQQLAERKRELQERAGGLAELERRSSGIETALRTLGDPRSRVKYLENETTREPELVENQRELDASLERLESERRSLIEDLEKEKFVVDGAAGIAAERASLHEAERHLAELRATLNAAKEREEQLAAERARFGEIRKTVQRELQ